MLVNGQPIYLEQEISLAEFLEAQHFEINRVAVELNGMIIPKAAYTHTFLKDTDQLEVVCFVGGG